MALSTNPIARYGLPLFVLALLPSVTLSQTSDEQRAEPASTSPSDRQATVKAEVVDPVGDTLFEGYDLTYFEAVTDDTSLRIVLEFADTIQPAASDSFFGLYGFVNFDIDQDPNTGATPTSANDCPQLLNLGVEFTLQLNTYDPDTGLAEIQDPTDPENFDPVGTVPVVFGDTSITADIPLALLNVAPGGIVNTAVTVGGPFATTDCAPNEGFIQSTALAEPPPPVAVAVPTLSYWSMLTLVGVFLGVSYQRLTASRKP